MGTRPRNTLHFNFFKLQVLKHLIFIFEYTTFFAHGQHKIVSSGTDGYRYIRFTWSRLSDNFVCVLLRRYLPGEAGAQEPKGHLFRHHGTRNFRQRMLRLFFHWQFALPPEAPSLASSLVSKTQNEHITKSRLKLWMDAGPLLEYCI